ncbi:TatD family hydrolase [Candidatus Bathyarchaeota archaeon]|nr:TatD family hydrolase [Candidatus Bathyarchaeota archaeon]MBS7627526.1 TatD family hydrolase [Candidatus Bathyarchaeota archaeon]
MDKLSLIDTHAHLDEVSDLPMVLERARDVGIIAIIAVGSDIVSNRRVLELAEAYRGYVFPALGMHPWGLENHNNDWEEFLRKNIERSVAIGEVGLDYRIPLNRDRQLHVFSRLVEIAKSYDKPLIIHSRAAWKDALEIVKGLGAKKAVFHWYSGPVKVLRDILALGYFISATPAAEYSQGHRRALRNTPLERILLETDSPVRYRGIESEPSDLRRVLSALAEIKGIDAFAVASATTENALRLFGLRL